MDNREFRVQEADLYNEKRYRLHDNKFKCSEKINELMNRRIKRESKRKALQTARDKMINNVIEKFLSTPSMVSSTKNALRILSRKQQHLLNMSKKGTSLLSPAPKLQPRPS